MCAGYCAELAIKIGHDAKLLRHGDQQVGKGGPVDVGRGHLSAYEIPAAIRRLPDKTAGKNFDDISQSAPAMLNGTFRRLLSLRDEEADVTHGASVGV